MQIDEQYMVQLKEHLENYSVTEIRATNNLSWHKQAFAKKTLLNQIYELDFNYVLLPLSLIC